MEDESELSHRFRLLNGENQFAQIKRAKEIMCKCLMDQHSVDKLEMNNPILFALGIRDDDFMRQLYRGMFMHDATKDNEIRKRRK
uniref:LigA domain-containing protein n=1 Tax=Globodera pallida TaxID=36090 RepID=A0A183BSN0_GLOPA